MEDNIGSELRLRRILHGLPQWKVVELAGTSQPVLSMIESGYKKATPEMIERIRKAIDQLASKEVHP